MTTSLAKDYCPDPASPGLSSVAGTSVTSVTRNFPFLILSIIVSRSIIESSNFTLTVDVAEFSLKPMTSVFFRIELILDLPDQSQHPETFRS